MMAHWIQTMSWIEFIVMMAMQEPSGPMIETDEDMEREFRRQRLEAFLEELRL